LPANPQTAAQPAAGAMAATINNRKWQAPFPAVPSLAVCERLVRMMRIG